MGLSNKNNHNNNNDHNNNRNGIFNEKTLYIMIIMINGI